MSPVRRVFVYEFVSGGGCYSAPAEIFPGGSLLAEGQAMLAAVAADWQVLPGTAVRVLRDRRLPPALADCEVRWVGSAAEERDAFAELARSSDGTLVIAPEIGGALLSRVGWVGQFGGTLWGPGPALVALAADKQRLAEHLGAAGVPVPAGRALEPGEPLPRNGPYPAVLKRRDGAGSQDIRRIDAWSAGGPLLSVPGRLEAFCPGQPASVALLCGPGGCAALRPCAQHLSDDGRFEYRGGRLPLPPELARRAQRLAERTAAALPEPRGYLGIDLVLGPAADGTQDYVIEVNPRLTTSYLGLRELCAGNLMAHQFDILAGRPAALCWRSGAVEFDAVGGAKWLEALAGGD